MALVNFHLSLKALEPTYISMFQIGAEMTPVLVCRRDCTGKQDWMMLVPQAGAFHCIGDLPPKPFNACSW